MKKASKILLLVGGILGLVLAVLWLSLSILWFVRAGLLTAYANGGEVSEAFKEWTIRWVEAHGYYYSSWETVVGVWTGKAVGYLIQMLLAIPSAIIAFILRGKEKTGLPLPIVLAVLSIYPGNIAAFVGAGLAIANWAVVERKEGQQPAEEKKEEKPEEPKAE